MQLTLDRKLAQWFETMKIRTKFSLAFGIIFLLVAIVAVVILFNIFGITNEFQDLNEIQGRLTTLADDIRYYDATLTDAVRAYLIDPQDQAAYTRYFQDAEALDNALAEAQRLATSAEDRQLFDNIDRVNVELVAIEERLLAEPDVATAVEIYRGTYGDLKAEYASYVRTFFDRQEANFQVSKDVILVRLQQSLTLIVVLVGVLLLVSIVISLGLSRDILTRLLALTEVTARFAGGDLKARVPVTSQDELGSLATAFNTMSQELGEIYSSLEQRTSDLEASAEIAGAANQVREISDLLRLAVNLIRDRFNFYYVQVYIIQGDFAVLREGTGDIGRRLLDKGHRLPLDGRSLVTEAINTGKPLIVQNTRNYPNFLPNELLPDTRAELTIPLRTKTAIIGVLDIQHNVPNAFGEAEQRLFQAMSDQLAVIFENVHLFETTQRRALQMQTVAEVSAAAASNLNTDELLKQVADLTKERFNLYHAHIYLLDETGENLVLAAGAGEAGRMMKEHGHSIPLQREQSLVARAARTREGIITNDVTQEPGFLPNLLLPETRSELAVPLVIGEQLIGVLDVQADVANRFDDEDLNVQITLAGQVAVAVNNARTFEQVHQAQENLAKQRAFLQRVLDNTPSAIFVKDYDGRFVLVNQALENLYGVAVDALIGKTDADFSPNPEEVQAFIDADRRVMDAGEPLFIPEEPVTTAQGVTHWYQTTKVPLISSDGTSREVLGIATDITERKLNELAIEQAHKESELLYQISKEINNAKHEQELVDIVVSHLVHATASIVALNLWEELDFDSATTITTAARWSRDGAPSMVTTLPVKHFPFLPYLDPKSIQVCNDVATDSRLDDQTRDMFLNFKVASYLFAPLLIGERWIGVMGIYSDQPHLHSEHQIHLMRGVSEQLAAAVERLSVLRQAEKRAAELTTVARVSATTTTLLDVDALLTAVVELTKQNFDLYHAHIYLYDPETDNLVLADGAGEAGQMMKQAGHSIPISREQSLVARAARTHEGVIVNDVLQEPGFLPNFLLPDTRSELAVPLVIGSELIGVLDVQSTHVNHFTAEDVRVQSTLADQIAVAINNARTFEQVKKSEATMRRLTDILENTSDFVATADTSGRITYLNPAAYRLMNFEADFDFTQSHIPDYYPAEEGQRIINEALPIAVSKGVWSGETVFLSKDGREIPTSEVIMSHKDPDGQVRFFSTIVRDISAQKQAAVALDEQRAFLQRVLDHAPSVIFVKDYNGRFVLANQAQGEMFLTTPGDLVGKTDLDFNPNPEEVAAFLEADRRVMDSGTSLFIPEEPVTNLQGVTKWYQTTKVPLVGTDGVSKQVLGIVTDITERKNSAEAISLAREESELLYAVSKEINAAKDEDELVNIIVRHLGYPEATAASLTLWDELDFEKTQSVNVAARWSRDEGIQRPLKFPLERLAFTALMDRYNVNFYDDVTQDPRIDDTGRDTLLGLGYHALILTPLAVGERWIGTMGIYAGQPYAHSERLVRLLRGVTEPLTAAVERLHVLRQAEKHAAELETVARVSAATTTLLDVDELLYAVSELTKDSFSLYHAHIYLLDDAGENLVLAAGAGEPGRMMKQFGHSIPLRHPNSLVARAARTRDSVVVNDIMQASDFLPNPLLPDTKAELAIPMIIGNQLIGVLDVQSDVTNHFTEQDVAVKTTLADQVAVAVNNARIYEVERKAADHLREVDRLKSQFLANMSHELRTPLNSIIGYSEVLLDGVDGELPGEAVEDVEAIHDSGRHLLALINEILDMAKIDAGQLHLDRKPTDLPKIVSEVLKVGQSLIKDKALMVEVIEESPVPQVYVDALRVRQILLNLVGNSVKFTEQGAITIRYGMHNHREIYLKVHDTGVGISEDNLKVIFERFRQVDGSSTRRAGGTGLGLSITQQLVHLHEGEIYAESEPGVGSTFWFTLPVFEGEVLAAELNGASANGSHS